MLAAAIKIPYIETVKEGEKDELKGGIHPGKTGKLDVPGREKQNDGTEERRQQREKEPAEDEKERYGKNTENERYDP